MLKYILKRLVHLIPVILVISIILFGLLQLMPGDPVMAYLGEGGAKLKPERIAQMRAQMGLDQPVYIQYFKWLQRTITGDFGESVQYKKPVIDLMGTFIWNSFIINITGFVLSFAISIPVGIKAAVNRFGFFDNFITVFSLVGISFPSFFLAMLVIFAFSINLGWFPLNGMITVGKVYESTWAYATDVMYHMVLPTLVITIGSLAGLVRYVRNAMLDVIKQDYIRTARSKGLSERVVIYKHAFRNALIPVVTLASMSLPGLFGGSIILETMFLWPGIGRVLYEAVTNRDYSVVMTSNLFFAVLMLIGNLIGDISYALVDPRVKVE